MKIFNVVPRMVLAISRPYIDRTDNYGQLLMSKVNMPLLPPYPNIPTLMVRSPMGTGKTLAYLPMLKDNNDRCVLISSRISFTYEMLGTLKEDPYNFVSYLDIEDTTIHLSGEHKRLIVQVESLHRLEIYPSRPVKILILDELESIIEQFSSPTMGKNRTNSYIVFEYILKSAMRVLCLDGNLMVDTAQLIKKLRGNFNLIYNTYKTEETYYMTNKIAVLENKLIELLRCGNNIVIASNIKKRADTLATICCNTVGPANVLYISSDTSKADKDRIFKSINEEFIKYRVVIYTPTVTAGCSFTRKHFDYHFDYFSTKSNTVLQQRQMQRRIRDIKSKTYYICYESNRAVNYDMDLIKKTKLHLKSTEDESLDTDITLTQDAINTRLPAGLIDILCLNEYNKSRSECFGLELFCKMIKLSGGTIKHMTGKSSMYEHNKARKETMQCKYMKIVDAPDITKEEVENILGDSVAEETNKYSMHRYRLRKAYNGYQGIIDLNFVKLYDNNKSINIYANLTDLCMNTTVDASFKNIVSNYSDCDDDNTAALVIKKHKVAIQLTRYCGFTDYTDVSVLTKSKVRENLEKVRDEIYNNNEIISNIFKIGISINNWNYKNTMAWINTILYNMYGYKIKAKGKGTDERDIISIQHEYYNELFDIAISETKPHIIPAWYKLQKDQEKAQQEQFYQQ
jgi:hypothetical protein